MNDNFTGLTGKLLTNVSEQLPKSLVVSSGCFLTVVSDNAWESEAIQVLHQISDDGKTLLAGTCDLENSEASAIRDQAAVFASCLLEQLRYGTRELVNFSKSRDIGDRKLYQDIHFRQVVGEILKLLELTELSLAAAERNLPLTFQYLNNISLQCGKTLGGRCLLSGSFFELQVISQLVGNTYAI